MPSLMNGLSSLGAGVAQFAGSAALEVQKSQLAQQQAILADQLATNRELNVTQPFQKSQLEASEAGANTRNAATNATSITTNALTNETSRSNNSATIAGEMARTQATINAPTETEKLFKFLKINPDGSSIGGASSSATPPATFDSGSSVSPDAAATPAGTAGAAPSPLNNPVVLKALGLPMPGSDDAVHRAIMGGVMSDQKFKDQPADVQAAEFKKRMASASASLSSDALDTLADRTIAGDTSALTGLGYGEGGAANRAAAQERITQKLKEQGLGGADLAAKIASFGGEKAGARTAGTREANVGMAVTEAQLFMPLALEASKLVPRTQFPTLNSILLSAEKGVGGENVVRLAVATNSLVNAYARAVTPSGIPTEGNQTRARELLDKAWGDGQYGAAIDQLSKEMTAAKQSPVQQQQEQAARISGRSTAPASAPAAQASKPTAAPDPLAMARDAIAQGAPPAEVAKRLRENGIDPSPLLSRTSGQD